MKKKPAVKPSHSMLDNSLWAVRMLWKQSPVLFWILLAFIPAEVGTRYLGILLPARVVAEVTQKQSYQHALLTVGSIMLALFVCGLAQKELHTLSQRVLQKNGFRTTGQDGRFRFFRVTREQFQKHFARRNELGQEG